MALKDVLGQERPIEIIKRSLMVDRIPHAYIFVGEEGIGKAFTAINLAKALNCDSSTSSLFNTEPPDTELVEVEACDNCPSCMEIDKGIHPDVLFIKPEGDQIKIEQIRMAEERLSLRALKGKRKVMIIDDAHMMNISSANALLKTLEEPTEGTVIILITPSPNLLPATVLSRCQWLPFSLLKREDIEEILVSKGLKRDEACLTASLSDGKIGRALTEDRERQLERREIFLTLFNSIRRPFYDISLLVEGIAKGEEERLEDLFHWGEAWFRDLLVFKVTHDHNLLINHDKEKEIEDTSERLSLNQLQDSFKVIHDTSRFVTLRANKQLALEVMMIKLTEILNPPSTAL